ncbi:MAG: hypothetical protein GEU74_14240 [Nitriliruptorales bacterium]|nr:hypothetical protein [Nitriliruptorales bacterium]
MRPRPWSFCSDEARPHGRLEPSRLPALHPLPDPGRRAGRRLLVWPRGGPLLLVCGLRLAGRDRRGAPRAFGRVRQGPDAVTPAVAGGPAPAQTRERGPVRVAVLGLGQAGLITLDKLLARPDRYHVVAAVDPHDGARAKVADSRVRLVPDLERLRTGEVEAVYVGSPTIEHEPQTEWALDRGLHVLVEKPLAHRAAAARALARRAARTPSVAMVCHKRGVDPGIRAIASLLGQPGRPRARLVSMLHVNDWVWRPRRPDEYDAEAGGGIVYRQGSHHFDMLLAIMGSASVVDAHVLDLGVPTHVDGAFTATLVSEQDCLATVVVSGYGGPAPTDPAAAHWPFGFALGGAAPAAAGAGAVGDKHELADRLRAAAALARRRPTPPRPFGMTLVQTDDTLLQTTEDGVLVHGRNGTQSIPVEAGEDGLDHLLETFFQAIRDGRAPTQDFRWGVRILELCEDVYRHAKASARARSIAVVPPGAACER